MSKKSSVDWRVAKACRILIDAPYLKVPNAMRAANFSSSEANDQTLQMRVRRHLKKVKELEGEDLEVPATVSVIIPSDPSYKCSSISLLSSSTATTAMTTTTASPKESPSTPVHVKKIRMSAKQAQQHRVNEKFYREKRKEAMKRATSLYENERAKGKGGLSALEVSKKIASQFDVNLSPRTIQHYVSKGLAGQSPVKRGCKGRIPPPHFKLLCGATESFIRIAQMNGDESECSRKMMMRRVNAVVGIADDVVLARKDRMFNRILKETGVNLNADASHAVEDRRIRWTTYNNLNVWFDSWEENLVTLGFGVRSIDGTVEISPEQMSRIINLDETCIALDGNKSNRGGRPSAVFYDPNLPRLGKAATKSSLSSTLITGSSASGEPLPPHFQFSTKATSEDRQKLRMELVAWMPGIRGTFGNGVERIWPVTFALNDKGGMDDDEFRSYFLTSVAVLYPDAEDKCGKRVMVKIDSGPGRLNMELLAELRILGFVLYPGVPNTTAVTQETDQNYSLFKSVFIENLEELTKIRTDNQQSVSFPPWICGLVVFGGIDEVTGCEVKRNAFETAFTKQKCLDAWEKVGAAPLTRACLKSKKVRHEFGVSGDPMTIDMIAMQQQNDFCCWQLSDFGYQGHRLKIVLKEKTTEPPITVPHSRERLDLIAKCRGKHGALFMATKGGPLTADDMFIGMEMPMHHESISKLEAIKKDRLAKQSIENDAKKILERTPPTPIDKLSAPELETLLAWHQVAKKDMGTKSKKLAMWRSITASMKPPPPYDQWTEKDEENLQNLKAKNIGIGDTALGRIQAIKRREFEGSFKSLSEQEREDYITKLKTIHETI